MTPAENYGEGRAVHVRMEDMRRIEKEGREGQLRLLVQQDRATGGVVRCGTLMPLHVPSSAY